MSDPGVGPNFRARHPELRWLVPAAMLAVAAVVAATAFNTTSSDRELPHTDAAQLARTMRASAGDGYSGTVVTKVGFDLPVELRVAVASLGRTPTPTALQSGSHTLRVWYGGRTRQRIELIRQTSEFDLFRAGSNVWQWDSQSRVAVHTTIASSDTARLPWTLSLSTPSALTPSALAGRMLAMLGANTNASVHAGPQVAERSSYVLDLEPKDPTSLVASVHIEIDGATGVPLGVQLYARGSASPNVAVAFSSVNFGAPGRDSFEFVAPDDATIRDVGRPTAGYAVAGMDAKEAAPADTLTIPATTGTGWRQVSSYTTTRAAAKRATGPGWQAVSGSWGSGHLYATPLLDTLVTSTGQVFTGAVEPSVLYSAAAG